MTELPLFRILQSQGIGTRRECQALIQRQQVSIAGELATDPERRYDCTNLAFSVRAVNFDYRAQAYLALHKPAGFECSHQPREHASVFSLLPDYLLRRGVQCVGRLDQDTTGLLLFSDDGRFIHDHTSPRKQIGKTYQVTCKHAFTSALIEQLLSGVQLHDEPQPLRARRCVGLNDRQLELVIHEGKYHQVKRMLAAAGNRVEALHRSAIGGYALPSDLDRGEWTWLSSDDLLALKGSDVTFRS